MVLIYYKLFKTLPNYLLNMSTILVQNSYNFFH